MPRNALAKLRRQVPAAAPKLQQLRHGKIVRIVVAAGDVESIAIAFQDDGIGAQHRVLFRRLRQLPGQFRPRLHRDLTNDQCRLIRGRKLIAPFHAGIRHALDVAAQEMRIPHPFQTTWSMGQIPKIPEDSRHPSSFAKFHKIPDTQNFFGNSATDPVGFSHAIRFIDWGRVLRTGAAKLPRFEPGSGSGECGGTALGST